MITIIIPTWFIWLFTLAFVLSIVRSVYIIRDRNIQEEAQFLELERLRRALAATERKP